MPSATCKCGRETNSAVIKILAHQSHCQTLRNATQRGKTQHCLWPKIRLPEWNRTKRIRQFQATAAANPRRQAPSTCYPSAKSVRRLFKQSARPSFRNETRTPAAFTTNEEKQNAMFDQQRLDAAAHRKGVLMQN